jgi:hypothetical protein
MGKGSALTSNFRSSPVSLSISHFLVGHELNEIMHAELIVKCLAYKKLAVLLITVL